MNELTLKNINKHYGKKHALKDFSFTFTDGVYGLLGPNSAGKSTLMHLITDNLLPDKKLVAHAVESNRYTTGFAIQCTVICLSIVELFRY
jgi:ABC-type multidrug transport system ATPase subunit